MWQFLAHLSIPRRLLLTATLAALLPGIVIGILGGSYIGTLLTINQTVQTTNNATQLVITMQADLLRMNTLLETLDVTSTDSPINVNISREIRNLIGQSIISFTIYQRDYQIANSPLMQNVRASLKNSRLGQEIEKSQHMMTLVVNKQWQNFKAAQNKILNDLQKKVDPGVMTNNVNQAKLAYLPLKVSIADLAKITENINQAVAQVNTYQIKPIFFWTIFALLLSTLVVFCISQIINLTITRPLRQLVSLTQRIANGDLEARAAVTGHNEMAQVATSMNTMLDSIVTLMQNTQKQRDSLQSGVEQLVTEVQELGTGDLCTEAEVTSDALGFLADSFNYMTKELNNLVVRVKMVAYEVEKLTGATRQRMTRLVTAGSQQIQDMTEAVNVVEQMAASAREVVKHVQFLANISQETRHSAQVGCTALEQACAGIQRIHNTVQATDSKVQVLDASLRQIDQIVKVIANIAHQTNRLALDASIQAALAGENGKGFAAVARDIRRLSEESNSQVNMIAALGRQINSDVAIVAAAINDTKNETADGIKQAGQAGRALTSIFEVVERQTHAIEEINISANEQFQFAKDVLQLMQSVADATKESNSSTEETNINIWQLAQLVERLRVSVDAFKLRDEQYIYKAIQHNLPYLTQLKNPDQTSGEF